MASLPLDRVKVFSATTGTGSSIALGSAVSDLFLSPSEAGMVDGATYLYVIEQGTDFEIGTGVYTASGTTIARSTPVKSKVGGTAGTTKITLNGSEVVYFPLANSLLGTAAQINTGTSGGTVPLLNGANSWGAAQTYLNSSGVKILDTNASHTLGLVGGSDLTSDRTLTITTGDASRTLSMSGNITVAGDFVTSGAYSCTLTLSNTTNVTLPTTGTLATTDASSLTSGSLSDARLSSNATAYGKQAVFIPAAAMTANTTNGPSSGSNEMSTNKNMLASLDFDATTSESAQFAILMPQSWNEGTVTFDPVWSHASTSTNFGVVWELSAVARSDNEAGDVAFGSGQTSTDTGGTTNNIYIGPESSAITVGQTPSAGDFVMFKIARLPANASDTLAIDARLHGIRLYLTTDAGHD